MATVRWRVQDLPGLRARARTTARHTDRARRRLRLPAIRQRSRCGLQPIDQQVPEAAPAGRVARAHHHLGERSTPSLQILIRAAGTRWAVSAHERAESRIPVLMRRSPTEPMAWRFLPCRTGGRVGRRPRDRRPPRSRQTRSARAMKPGLGSRPTRSERRRRRSSGRRPPRGWSPIGKRRVRGSFRRSHPEPRPVEADYRVGRKFLAADDVLEYRAQRVVLERRRRNRKLLEPASERRRKDVGERSAIVRCRIEQRSGCRMVVVVERAFDLELLEFVQPFGRCRVDLLRGLVYQGRRA